MRTILILTLAVGGCASKADEPSSPPPLFLKVHLQPANYVSHPWNEENWTLIRGLGPLHHPDVFTRFGDGQLYFPTQNWSTLYRNAKPRFVLEEKPDQLRILAVTGRTDRGDDEPPTYREFAQIPLPLQPGLSWESRRAGQKGEILDKATCSAERVEVREGGQVALRVDIAQSGEIRTSLWFDRTGSLLRWDGISPESVALAPGNPLPFQLGVAAASYASYGRVDEVRRWAPTRCAGPPEPRLRTSESRDEATHGRKQYYLYALDRDAYLRARQKDQPDGQIIVKESWIPLSAHSTGRKDSRLKGPLFIMVKQGGDWTYATATADGKTITASGRLASCVECHDSDRTRDRMFGLTSSKGGVGMEED